MRDWLFLTEACLLSCFSVLSSGPTLSDVPSLNAMQPHVLIKLTVRTS